MDLREFQDATYGITSLLGPMYHLYTAEEQLKVMSEAIRITKNEMTDDVYKKYLDYHLCICERADMIGISNHFLDIFRKE